MSTAIQSINPSILTRQMQAALSLWRVASSRYAADVAAGLLPPGVPFDKLPPHVRDLYLATAEGEMAAPPAFPVRDEVVGRDQVTRAERARVLPFAPAGVR